MLLEHDQVVCPSLKEQVQITNQLQQQQTTNRSTLPTLSAESRPACLSSASRSRASMQTSLATKSFSHDLRSSSLQFSCKFPTHRKLSSYQLSTVATIMDGLRAVNVTHLRRNICFSVSTLVTTVLLFVLLGLHLTLNEPPYFKGAILYTNATVPALLPPLPPITMLTSAYKGQYSAERRLELSLISNRNQRLSSISRYHRLFEYGMNFTPSQHVTGRVLSLGENVTYRGLFSEAQDFGGVVVLANADIYFDESLLCASMVSPRAVLALSRHPSPDCFARSARGDRGREPVDFCDGYHPKHQASHDVFIFAPPLPISFLDALENLRVNEFGAENVVIALLKAEGYHVVNPCANIHAFHQHCTGERAASAKAGAKSVADARGQFAGTFRSGYVHGSQWMDSHFAARFGAVDCLGFGMMHGESLRNR